MQRSRSSGWTTTMAAMLYTGIAAKPSSCMLSCAAAWVQPAKLVSSRAANLAASRPPPPPLSRSPRQCSLHVRQGKHTTLSRVHSTGVHRGYYFYGSQSDDGARDGSSNWSTPCPGSSNVLHRQPRRCTSIMNAWGGRNGGMLGCGDDTVGIGSRTSSRHSRSRRRSMRHGPAPSLPLVSLSAAKAGQQGEGHGDLFENSAAGAVSAAAVAANPAAGRPIQAAEGGVVYFVSTPIGNLEDITLRAMNVLRTADVIAAEDTRTTGSLLKLLGVRRTGRLVSHHDHNTRRRVPEIVEAAREGKSVAVVSDAGTPGISDPGTELAAACAAEGIRVVPVPGACAAVAAVSVAGFASREFVFFGFVSGKRGSAVRRRKLTEIAKEPRTCIMYESPHRIADTLQGLLSASCSSAAPGESGTTSTERELDGYDGCDDGSGGGVPSRSEEGKRMAATGHEELLAGRRPVVLARELTKLHEEIFRGTLAEAVARYGGDAGGGGTTNDTGYGESGAAAASGSGGYPRGEFTVVLGPRTGSDSEEGGVEGAARSMAALEARLIELTAGGMSTSSAVKMASKDLNLKKSDVYRVALRLQNRETKRD